MYALSARNVTKSYGKKAALKGLTLEVEEGTIYCLVGPNGAGKTTFVRCALGVLRPDSGEIRILGRKMPNKEILREVGYMPQDLGLYLELSVEENLRFFGRIYGIRGKELKERVEEVLELVKLEEWRKALVEELSGGMERRLSLGIALLPRPKLLILDEPTVGVDPELRAEFWKYFKKVSEEGITILVTTHYMDEAERCDVVGLIKSGKLLYEGSPSKIMEEFGVRKLEEAFLAIMRCKK